MINRLWQSTSAVRSGSVLLRIVSWVAVSGSAFAVTQFAVKEMSQSAIRRAETLIVLGDVAEARRSLERMLSNGREPGHREYLIGVTYLEDKAFGRASEYFNQVKHGSKWYREAQKKQAGCLILDDRLEDAEESMRECLQRHPDEIAMRLQLAAVLSRQLRKSEAAEILRKGLEFTTDRGDIGQIELLLNLLKVEFDPPLPEDCLPALRRSLQKYPSQVGVRLAVARCLSALGRDMEANRILFDELTPFVHRNRDVWLAVFHRHVIAGNLKQADGMLRQVTGDERGRAARRADGDHRLQLARSMLHERLGENEQALALLQSADRSRSGSREVLVRQARLLQKVGRPSESAAAFERVHRIAKAELAIWHLLTTLGDRKPVSEECLSFAERLYESERPEQARAWRDLADRLVPGTGDSGAVRTDGAQQ